MKDVPAKATDIIEQYKVKSEHIIAEMMQLVIRTQREIEDDKYRKVLEALDKDTYE